MKTGTTVEEIKDESGVSIRVTRVPPRGQGTIYQIPINGIAKPRRKGEGRGAGIIIEGICPADPIRPNKVRLFYRANVEGSRGSVMEVASAIGAYIFPIEKPLAPSPAVKKSQDTIGGEQGALSRVSGQLVSVARQLKHIEEKLDRLLGVWGEPKEVPKNGASPTPITQK